MHAKTPRYLQRREAAAPSLEDARLNPARVLAWAEAQMKVWSDRRLTNEHREGSWSQDEARLCESNLHLCRGLKLEAVTAIARTLLSACRSAREQIKPSPAAESLLAELGDAIELGTSLQS